MDVNLIYNIFDNISLVMTDNREYLINLDAQNGDGDLGISMDVGFRAVVDLLKENEETDLGKVFLKVSKTLNEAAPSSLGTILSFMFLGMAKSLRGKTNISFDEMVSALDVGIALIMDKANSKPGEKTILDALYPALNILKETSELTDIARLEKAVEAAKKGSESTKQMKAVHGRAAYYGDKSIGVLDAGSVVGRLLFEGAFKSL